MVFILVWTRIGLSFSLLCEDFLKKLKVFFFIDFYGSLFYELINIWNEDFSSNFGQWCLCSSEEWTGSGILIHLFLNIYDRIGKAKDVAYQEKR